MTPEQAKKELDEKGFVVLEGVLTPQECDAYKVLLEADTKKYAPLYADTKKSEHGLESTQTVKVVYNLHNKHLEYYKLFDHPKVLPILDLTLKEGSYQTAEPYLLLNTSARCPLPDVPPQQLHVDSNLPGNNYPLIMVVMWIFDDFSKENGSTRIVPGSHKLKTYPENGKVYPDEVYVTAPPGSVLIYNGNCWHGNGLKTLPGDRWAAIFGYGRWFIKPSFDYMQNMPQDMFDKITDAQKELLGYKSNPPKDEFTRLRRRSGEPERPNGDYHLPA